MQFQAQQNQFQGDTFYRNLDLNNSQKGLNSRLVIKDFPQQNQFQCQNQSQNSQFGGSRVIRSQSSNNFQHPSQQSFQNEQQNKKKLFNKTQQGLDLFQDNIITQRKIYEKVLQQNNTNNQVQPSQQQQQQQQNYSILQNKNYQNQMKCNSNAVSQNQQNSSADLQQKQKIQNFQSTFSYTGNINNRSVSSNNSSDQKEQSFQKTAEFIGSTKKQNRKDADYIFENFKDLIKVSYQNMQLGSPQLKKRLIYQIKNQVSHNQKSILQNHQIIKPRSVSAMGTYQEEDNDKIKKLMNQKLNLQNKEKENINPNILTHNYLHTLESQNSRNNLLQQQQNQFQREKSLGNFYAQNNKNHFLKPNKQESKFNELKFPYRPSLILQDFQKKNQENQIASNVQQLSQNIATHHNQKLTQLDVQKYEVYLQEIMKSKKTKMLY